MNGKPFNFEGFKFIINDELSGLLRSKVPPSERFREAFIDLTSGA
jgi:hypothetical protein